MGPHHVVICNIFLYLKERDLLEAWIFRRGINLSSEEVPEGRCPYIILDVIINIYNYDDSEKEEEEGEGGGRRWVTVVVLVRFIRPYSNLNETQYDISQSPPPHTSCTRPQRNYNCYFTFLHVRSSTASSEITDKQYCISVEQVEFQYRSKEYSCEAANLMENYKRFGENYCQEIKGRRDDPEHVKYVKISLKHC